MLENNFGVVVDFRNVDIQNDILHVKVETKQGRFYTGKL